MDQHNCDQQATLCLQHKFKTHDWSTLYVNMSIIAMCIIDTLRVWSRISDTGETSPIESQKQLYGNLSPELIDNTQDKVGGVAHARTNHNQQDDNIFDPEYIDPVVGSSRSGDSVYLCGCTKKKEIPTMYFKVHAKYVIKQHHTTPMTFVSHGFVIEKVNGHVCFATQRALDHNG